MNKLEQFATQMDKILDRCDGGKNYKWRDAANDMGAILKEMERYNPRSKGSRLILQLLKNDARGWIENWMKGHVWGGSGN